MIEYHDAYLAPLIDKTPEFETRAAEDVAQLGSFPAPWPDKLTVLRAYILCCTENGAGPDDAFAVKLRAYRQEWAAALQAARIAANTAAARPAVALAIPVERG